MASSNETAPALSHFDIVDRTHDGPANTAPISRDRLRRRVQDSVDKAIRDTVTKGGVRDIGKDGKVRIPLRGLRQPTISHDPDTGFSRRVAPGNRDLMPGDDVIFPKGGGGGNGSGNNAGNGGDGEDDFYYEATPGEAYARLFELMELPDMLRKMMESATEMMTERAGFTNEGPVARRDDAETFKMSIARRRALGRPSKKKIRALEEAIAALEALDPRTAEQEEELTNLRLELEAALAKRRKMPFIDPRMDSKYRHYEQRPVPTTQAVFYCLMDVSASMGETEKYLAKLFFDVIELFLDYKYDQIDVVFIRHTHEAQIVDRETFYFSRDTGGTVASTCLERMIEDMDKNHPPAEWNIYAAHASDGDNATNDNTRYAELMRTKIMTQVNFFAYVEIVQRGRNERQTELWKATDGINTAHDNFHRRRIADEKGVGKVLIDLFHKDKSHGKKPAGA